MTDHSRVAAAVPEEHLFAAADSESSPKVIHVPGQSDRLKVRLLNPKTTAFVRGAQVLLCAAFDLDFPVHVPAELHEVRRPIPKSKNFVRGAAKLLSASFDLDFQAVASHEPAEPESRRLKKMMREPKPAPSTACRTYRKRDAGPYFQIRILDIAIA